MSPAEIVALVLLVLILAVVIFLLSKLRSNRGNDTDLRIIETLHNLKSDILSKQIEGITSLRDSLERANQTLDERMTAGNVNIDKRLQIIGEIENRLGQLQQQASQLETIGSNIQSLSEILRPPKLRGGFGEILLENMLAEIMPEKMFDRQYTIGDGKKVDAVVTLGDKMLPIDSKFPLESFERFLADEADKSAASEFRKAMKKHVDDIADKYILPHQGTTDFALMYIPAEAVYAQFVSNRNSEGFEYALSRKVIPTSPGHLYGFLVAVSELYRQTALSSSDHRELINSLRLLADSVEALKSLHQRLDGSIRSLTTTLDKANKEINRMESGLIRLRDPDADNNVREEVAAETETEEIG